VHHDSFHILDPDWGHVTIKMSGHPHFGAQVILNGHEYVAAQAQKAGVEFTQQENRDDGFAVPPPPGSSRSTEIPAPRPPGEVIGAFGSFVVGGNYVIGPVIFLCTSSR
jgi:hypothetical protein